MLLRDGGGQIVHRDFVANERDEVAALWRRFLKSPLEMGAWHLAFLALVAFTLPALAADTTNLRTHLLEQIVLLKLEYRDRMLVASLAMNMQNLRCMLGWLDAGAVGTGVADNTTGVYTITTVPLADGNHPLTPVATDEAGNSATGNPATVTVNSGLPAGPVITGIGTDTGGSCRVPASYCGIVGYKSSHGRVPLTGCYPLSPSLDSIGPIALAMFAALGEKRGLDMTMYFSVVLAIVFTVLVFIILFIQKRPRGLFALKGRAVES
mgnify:CR=1 FL=1